MAIVLEELAEKWEHDKFIRGRARETGSLIKWPSPTTVGVPSVKALQGNAAVLCHTAAVWVSVFDYEAAGCPRTPPLSAVKTQVKKFYRLLDRTPTKVQVHADAWGVRKLTAHVFRILRQSSQPRAEEVRTLFNIYLDAWYLRGDEYELDENEFGENAVEDTLSDANVDAELDQELDIDECEFDNLPEDGAEADSSLDLEPPSLAAISDSQPTSLLTPTPDSQPLFSVTIPDTLPLFAETIPDTQPLFPETQPPSPQTVQDIQTSQPEKHEDPASSPQPLEDLGAASAVPPTQQPVAPIPEPATSDFVSAQAPSSSPATALDISQMETLPFDFGDFSLPSVEASPSTSSGKNDAKTMEGITSVQGRIFARPKPDKIPLSTTEVEVQTKILEGRLAGDPFLGRRTLSDLDKQIAELEKRLGQPDKFVGKSIDDGTLCAMEVVEILDTDTQEDITPCDKQLKHALREQANPKMDSDKNQPPLSTALATKPAPPADLEQPLVADQSAGGSSKKHAAKNAATNSTAGTGATSASNCPPTEQQPASDRKAAATSAESAAPPKPQQTSETSADSEAQVSNHVEEDVQFLTRADQDDKHGGGRGRGKGKKGRGRTDKKSKEQNDAEPKLKSSARRKSKGVDKTDTAQKPATKTGSQAKQSNKADAGKQDSEATQSNNKADAGKQDSEATQSNKADAGKQDKLKATQSSKAHAGKQDKLKAAQSNKADAGKQDKLKAKSKRDKKSESQPSSTAPSGDGTNPETNAPAKKAKTTTSRQQKQQQQQQQQDDEQQKQQRAEGHNQTQLESEDPGTKDDSQKAASSKRKRSNDKSAGEISEKAKATERLKQQLKPGINHYTFSTVIPYWSREAVGLKVLKLIPETNTWKVTQAFYLSAPGRLYQALALIQQVAQKNDEMQGNYEHHVIQELWVTGKRAFGQA